MELLSACEDKQDDIKELFKGIEGVYKAEGFGHTLLIQKKEDKLLPLTVHKGNQLVYQRSNYPKEIYVSLPRLLGEGKSVMLDESNHLSEEELLLIEIMERVVLSELANDVRCATFKPNSDR